MTESLTYNCHGELVNEEGRVVRRIVQGGQGRTVEDMTMSAFAVAWAMAGAGVAVAVVLGFVVAKVAGY